MKAPRAWSSSSLLLGTLLFAGFSASESLAATYYVATTGNDSNPGTQASPWKTLYKAGATAVAGDTVYIRGGNYTVGDPIYIQNSGTASNWIKFIGYPGEKPVFVGTNLNTTVDDAVIHVDTQSYILLDNLHINESRGQGISVYKSNFVTVQNCSTYLTWKSGIGIWGDLLTKTPSKNIKVLNNKVQKANSFDAPGADPTLAQSPHEAISCGRVEDFEVAYNEVWGGDKEGIDAKGPCKRGKIHSNVVHDQSATSIYVDGWSDLLEDIEVYNNIVRDTKTGIAIAAEGGTPLRNVRIHNNQLIRIQRVAFGIGGYGSQEQGKTEGDKSDIKFINNTINGADHVFNTTSSKTTDVIIRNNIHWGIRYKETVIGTGVNLTTQRITIDYNLPKTTDPKFVNAAADDLRLQASSPAINAGHPDAQYNDPDGTRNDMGAIPFGTAPAKAAPTITTQPASATKSVGQSVTFSVVATGNPTPTYQWRKGTTNISGATSASYTISSVATGDAANYSVVVTNSEGSVTSNNATLTVQVPPAITTQPTSQTVAAGGSVTFSVVATGTPAPTYQWRKGTTDISGATSASYTISAVASGDAGTYSVVVTNAAGSVTSSDATLTVGTTGGGTTVQVDSNDTTKVTFTGSWYSVGAGTAVGGTFMTVANVATSNLTYKPGVAGTYFVEVWQPSTWSRLSPGTKFTVNHSGGATNFTVNQQTNAGKWARLGTTALTLTTNSTIVVNGAANQDSDATVEYPVADAIRLVPSN